MAADVEPPMRAIATALPEVQILEPTVHRDTRGFFLESYRADQLAAIGISCTFVQDNHSRSVARTLRGLHWQWRRPQAKLIRVVAGAIFNLAAYSAVLAYRARGSASRWR